ncbi:MAG: Mut7-C RNAse domain-containing protein [Thermodesulfobacteriota bacterium]|nr:Mut7-C RNAse domain-containing protein [Thermodesulfobacteriota bacterium]
MTVTFLADSMLGKLAKWLRVMGYDTHYQSFYNEGVIEQLMHEGRRLLSRHRATIEQYPNSILILSDHVKEQLDEIRTWGGLKCGRSHWFSRCLICNVNLEEADAVKARENVPEHVFYESFADNIRFCPSCCRYYWPGSHRKMMIRQLGEWGF